MILSEIWKDRVFTRKLFKLTLPIALQSLMLALVAAADAFMLGKVSQDAMSAVSLATQIQFVQNMILGALVAGVGVLGAQYWGKHDTVILRRLFGSSIRESFLISFLFFAGCLLIPEQLMKLFASDPLLIGIGAEYLKIASWSYLLTGISQCYLAIMRVSEHAQCSAWISSGAVVLNILLNAVFIFGLAGVPAMGVQGAALATLLARIAELGCCVAVSRGRSFIPLEFRSIFTFDKVLLKDFWHYSLPLLGAYMLWGTGFTTYTAILGHLGRDAAAANSIAAVVRDLTCCLTNGMAGGAGIIIGNELGAGRLAVGKRYGDYALVLSLAAGLLTTVIILTSIVPIAGFVQLTDQAHTYMVQMFVILSFYMIGRSFCTVVINGIFDSGGDTLFDMYSLAVCMWGIALPCAFFAAFRLHLPPPIVFACTCLDEVGKMPWVIHHYRKYKWVQNITRP